MELVFHLLLVLTVMATIYSAIFRAFAHMEGLDYGWSTALYWTFTVMTTLGMGDVILTTPAGQIFTVIVLLSGITFLLVLIPFTFYQFVHSEARVPRGVPKEWKGHVVITHYDPVSYKLIRRLERFRHPYVLIVSDLNRALTLYDQGLNVVQGDLDSLGTYRNVQVDKAVLVATTGSDEANVNIAHTVRELSDRVPIISTAKEQASVDILELAGSNYVLQLDTMMGEYLARRIMGGDAISHVIGQFDQLLIAEAMVVGTPLIGKTLRESRLRETTGVTVIGLWERGKFQIAAAHAKITPETVLVLCGSGSQMQKYNQAFSRFHTSTDPIIVIGGGRVGRATGRALVKRNIDYRIVEKLPERLRPDPRYVLGSAAEREILEQAGIMKSPAVVITTHEDDVNIYLTIYCRRLRPDIQIISRATRERNVHTLHRAGADFCMSYASMGANIIMNRLKRSDILILAEGLDVFRVKVPPAVVGKAIAETSIRQETGCSIVSVQTDSGMQISPDPSTVLNRDSEMILIGTVQAEERFMKLYGEGRPGFRFAKRIRTRPPKQTSRRK